MLQNRGGGSAPSSASARNDHLVDRERRGIDQPPVAPRGQPNHHPKSMQEPFDQDRGQESATMSMIDPATLQAYLETEYRVLSQPAFGLRVGRASVALLELHQRARVDCSAFITACNPHSQLLDEAANRSRQADLARELSDRGFAFLPGIGRHPSNGWPGEDSFLVPGMTLEDAKGIGSLFGQNAIIWCGADATARLILLR